MQKKRQAIARVLSLKTIAIAVSSSEEDPPAVALDDENLARHSPLSPTPILFPTFVSPPRLIHVLEVPEYRSNRAQLLHPFYDISVTASQRNVSDLSPFLPPTSRTCPQLTEPGLTPDFIPSQPSLLLHNSPPP